MGDAERVAKDIELLEDQLRAMKPGSKAESILIDLARRYCTDAQFYLDKTDFVTAFGCINYAWGMIDAILTIHGQPTLK